MRTELIENTPAQQDSKFSNGRLSGLFCWPQWQDINNSVQHGSKFSKLVVGSLGGLRSLRILGWKTKMETDGCPVYSAGRRGRTLITLFNMALNSPSWWWEVWEV